MAAAAAAAVPMSAAGGGEKGSWEEAEKILFGMISGNVRDRMKPEVMDDMNYYLKVTLELLCLAPVPICSREPLGQVVRRAPRRCSRWTRTSSA